MHWQCRHCWRRISRRSKTALRAILNERNVHGPECSQQYLKAAASCAAIQFVFPIDRGSYPFLIDGVFSKYPVELYFLIPSRSKKSLLFDLASSGISRISEAYAPTKGASGVSQWLFKGFQYYAIPFLQLLNRQRLPFTVDHCPLPTTFSS